MNHELNKNILKEAINQLPEHEPSTDIWQLINTELDLQKGIQELPLYTPKAEIWEQINQQLPSRKPKLFAIQKWAIAASILFCLGISFWLFNSTQTTSLSYAIESVDERLLVADWDEDEGLFEEVSMLCQVKTYSCTAPEFQLLEIELNELNEAKSNLKQAIDSFGKDTELISQLSEIELARTAVLKKMIATIL